MKTLKQPVTTSMPTKIRNHLSKGRSRKPPGRLNPPATNKNRCESNQANAYSQIQPRMTSLDPTKVTELIHELSDLRETLAPQVPNSIPAGKRLFVTPEPLWEISGEARDDGKVLLIRHPGIGWLGFIIPHDDCKRLAKKLTGKLG